jgi:hypothetical protein
MIKLKIPKLVGGVPEIVAAPGSPELRAIVKTLVARADRIRDGGVDPRDDNMLAITNDGRKAALDIRLYDPLAPDHSYSKLNMLVDKLYQVWNDTAEHRLTQLVFCDLSRPVTSSQFETYLEERERLKNNEIAGIDIDEMEIYDLGKLFSCYNDVRRKLEMRGIPADEIAFMQEYKTDLQKANLFKAVRAGRIRIVIGSTSTMGLGTNFQDLLYYVHHLDAPWRPSDIEQRDGRMMRRGNTNDFCYIVRYVTEGSFDTYIWQLLHYKLTMINQIMSGDATIRTISDNDGCELSYAQIKAISSGNPLVLEKATLDATIAKLSRAKKSFEDKKYYNRRELSEYPLRLSTAKQKYDQTMRDIEKREDTKADLFKIVLDNKEITDRPEAGGILRQLLIELTHTSLERRVITIGHFAGFPLAVSVKKGFNPELMLMGEKEHAITLEIANSSPTGNLQALEHLPRRMEASADNLKKNIEFYEQQIAELERIKDSTFPKEDELANAIKRQKELEQILHEDNKSKQDLTGFETALAEEEDESIEEAA